MIRSKNITVLFILFAFFFTACNKEEETISMNYESYRFELWKNLINDNWQFDFIGTRKDQGNYPNHGEFNFDKDHEGNRGSRTDQVLTQLDNVLANTGSPDVVLLGVGGNDLLQGKSVSSAINNINLIIDALQDNNSNVIVFLEQIAPAREEFFDLLSDELLLFNNEIIGVANNQTNTNSQVISVNMNAGWSPFFFADEIHYNEAGAKVVADRYFHAIKKQLSVENSYKILPLGDSRVEGNRLP